MNDQNIYYEDYLNRLYEYVNEKEKNAFDINEKVSQHMNLELVKLKGNDLE